MACSARAAAPATLLSGSRLARVRAGTQPAEAARSQHERIGVAVAFDEQDERDEGARLAQPLRQHIHGHAGAAGFGRENGLQEPLDVIPRRVVAGRAADGAGRPG